MRGRNKRSSAESITIPRLEYKIEPSSALPKPITSKPSKKDDAIQKTTALITNKNRPIVKRVTGSVKINKTGRTTKLRRPMTNAAPNAELNPLTIMP